MAGARGAESGTRALAPIARAAALVGTRYGAPLSSSGRARIGRGASVARGVAVGKDGFPLEEDFPLKKRQVAPLLYVRQVMNTDVISLSEESTLRDALELFLEQRVSGAPVLNRKGRLVGVLSMTDIIWVESTEAMNLLPFHSSQDGDLEGNSQVFGAEAFDMLNMKVSSRMSRNVISIEPSELLDKGAALMIEKGINRLPVVDPQTRSVVGIITRLDIMRCLAAVWL